MLSLCAGVPISVIPPIDSPLTFPLLTTAAVRLLLLLLHLSRLGCLESSPVQCESHQLFAMEVMRGLHTAQDSSGRTWRPWWFVARVAHAIGGAIATDVAR